MKNSKHNRGPTFSSKVHKQKINSNNSKKLNTMHNKTFSFMGGTKSLLMLLAFACTFFVHCENTYGQLAAYSQQPFAASIPYNVATPNLRVTTTDWSYAKITGSQLPPNDFQWVNAGANPAAVNQNITGFTAGAGFVRYINRTTAYPALSGAPNGDAAMLASRSLDFSGHTTPNNSNGAGAPDTLGISIFRDNTGACAGVADSVQVWLNNQPSLTGAVKLSYTHVNGVLAATGSVVNRSTTLAPATAVLGWNRYAYQIPNLPQFFSGGTGCNSVYVIVACYSLGGNNIFIDNFNYPQWATPMAITGAQIFYQESADVGRNTTQQLLLGVRVTTSGSSAALKLDGATFSPNGSTNWLNDVVTNGTMIPPYCYTYFTGGTNIYATSGGAVNIPWNSTGPTVGQLNFGYWVNGCGAYATPTTLTLNPGTENYLWFSVDVKATAIVGNYIGADFQYIVVKTGIGCTAYGAPGSSTGAAAAIAPGTIAPQTLNLARMVDQSYTIPTYTAGTSWAGGSYTNNDFVSAVDFQGDNGTMIRNYYHNDSCAAALAVHPIGDPVRNLANRYACHPPDYTQFYPSNLGLYKNRGVAQVTAGRGARGLVAGGAYTIKVNPGTWFGNNTIGVFIDWNKDGDFDDRYGTTATPGPNQYIYENYGSQSLTQGDMSVPLPAGVWPTGWSFSINVPGPSGETVVDMLDPGQPPGNTPASQAQIFLGNVRLRVREIYAAPSSPAGVIGVHPTNSGFTWGEVEDYTIQVLDNCPAPALNVCKWIGTTNDWSQKSNWCPDVPTINDMAYIPLVGGTFSYPTIKSSTAAVCRELKLMDNGLGTGAQLNIDAPTGSSFTVADKVTIGVNAPAGGSTANINVNSSYNATLTIPGKSSAPPAGLALVGQTPFRTNAQTKTQIRYSGAELGSTYGWKAGDIIDQISIEVNSISTPTVSTIQFRKLRIQAYLVNPATPQFTFPAPVNTKSAFMPGDASVIAGWPKNIYPVVQPDTDITFTAGLAGNNFPMLTAGTQAGGNYYTFNLKPNTLIWDGVNDLVLSFENNTNTGLAPAKQIVLYDETNGKFNVLSVNGSIVSAGPITGFSIDGAGHYGGVPGATNGSITATVSNNRPRLDFTWHRPYTKFPITVGGDWINNNKGRYGASLVDGSDGFRAGWSVVEFNPAVRTSNSPGYIAPNAPNTWNPIATSTTLVADQIQNITTQLLVAANASPVTVFNNLEINKLSVGLNPVQQNSAVLDSIHGSFADTVLLTNGIFYMNRKEFTLLGNSPSCLTRTGGYIRSEDNTGPLAGHFQSKFTWNIGTGAIGYYDVWFGDSPKIFKVRYKKTTLADIGYLSLGTYGTPSNNTSWPVVPQKVNSMNTNPTPVLDATPWTVDRFWFAKVINSPPVGDLIYFEWDNVAEGTMTANYVAGEMKAQRYETTGWQVPFAGQADSLGITAAPSDRCVRHPAEYLTSAWPTWTVVRTNLLQAPLPLTVISFDGKEVDKRVKLWWTVQSEADVKDYSIERAVDQNFYEFIGSRMPVGPSTALLTYDMYDNKPNNGTNYYRLGVKTTDGAEKYYGPIAVKFGTDGLFDITNVKAEDMSSINVSFNYDSTLPCSVYVTDLLGNIVASGNYKAVIGENTFVLPSQLTNGIYFLTIKNSEKQVTKKFIY